MEIETLQASPQAAKEMTDLLSKTVGLPKAETPAEVEVAEETPDAIPATTEPKKTETPVVDKKDEITEDKKPAEKAWYETTSTSTDAPKTEVEDKTDYKDKYSKITKNPLLKALIEAEDAGKNVLDAFKELQPVNYKAMSMEQLAEAYGKSKGWSDDDISDEISKMEGKTRTEIENITSTWLNKLDADQAGKMEKFASDNKQVAEQQKQAELHIQQTFEKDLKAECELMLANEINGVKLTKDHVNDFIKTSVEFAPTREDGTISREVLRYYWLGRNLNQFMGAAKAEGASEGREEVLETINRPNPQTSQPQRLPEVKQPLTAQQEADALINARLGRK
jgi:hypothetical protein